MIISLLVVINPINGNHAARMGDRLRKDAMQTIGKVNKAGENGDGKLVNTGPGVTFL